MKIAFMGTAELSCATLEQLAHDKQFSVVAVVTQPDRPKGREMKLQPSPVKALALKLHLPVLQPARARHEPFLAELRVLQPDLIVVAAYGQILPQALLDLPRFGCLNVHTSLLPRYRGAAPIQWAMANGDTETGVTVMKMDAGLDTGPIVAQRRAPILPEDTGATLHDRLARLGAELLVETIPGFASGEIQPQPQPSEGVSHARKIKKEDGRVDWDLSAREILNRLRAFTPWPGAFTSWSSSFSLTRSHSTLKRELQPHLLKIWKAEIAERSGPAGEVLAADKFGIVVGCGQHALRILELQPENGRRMMAAEFLAGHKLNAGDKFAA